MKNTCYILRGLPGTGKSTLARLIKGANAGYDYYVEIFSTDDLFINEEGVYEFDPSMLRQHHQENLRRATEYFARVVDVEKEYPPEGYELRAEGIAIIDNTNVQHWEYEPYVTAAEEAGWDVQIIPLAWNYYDIPEYAKRTKHGVPEEAIRRMADRWEDLPKKYVVFPQSFPR
tara:strand:+ start:949 stop:1467 length:519 start_codon:yes stop_codon:yes gene_type:complete